jgi:hypothetical protein
MNCPNSSPKIFKNYLSPVLSNMVNYLDSEAGNDLNLFLSPL